MPPSDVPVARATPPGLSFHVYSWLIAFPIACFTLALGADVLYWRTFNLMWLEFSAWLLLAGLVAGVAALPFGAIDFLGDPERRASGAAWAHATGQALVLVIAFFNNLAHAADGWTAVMPWGLTLSAITVLAMILIGLLGASRAGPGFSGGRRYA